MWVGTILCTIVQRQDCTVVRDVVTQMQFLSVTGEDMSTKILIREAALGDPDPMRQGALIMKALIWTRRPGEVCFLFMSRLLKGATIVFG